MCHISVKDCSLTPLFLQDKDKVKNNFILPLILFIFLLSSFRASSLQSKFERYQIKEFIEKAHLAFDSTKENRNGQNMDSSVQN